MKIKNKKLLHFLLIGSLSWFITGCSPNDLHPDNVTAKMIQLKHKAYVSMHKSFLNNTLKKNDISEEEYNDLKELWYHAMRAGDFSVARKIMSFEPFRERARLEKTVNKLLAVNYERLPLNSSLLRRVDINLLDKYQKVLSLARKYKMYSLEKKLIKASKKIEKNYEIGLSKLFNYLMVSGAYEKQSPEFILKLSKKLFEIHKNEEAKTLLISFVKYKANEDKDFNIKPFYYLLVQYHYVKDANNINEYAKNAKAKKLYEYAINKLEKNADFDINEILNSLKKLGFVELANELNKKKEIFLERQKEKEEKRKILALKDKLFKLEEVKNLINKMIKQQITDYCLGRYRKLLIDEKSVFGNIQHTVVPLNEYVIIKKVKSNYSKVSLESFKIEEAKFYAFCLKNTLFIYKRNKDEFFKMNHPNNYYLYTNIRGIVNGLLMINSIPKNLYINISDLRGKKFKVSTNVDVFYVARGLYFYLKEGPIEDIPYKIMLIYSYLATYTNNSLLNSSDTFKCKLGGDMDDIMLNFVKILANRASNPKIAILIYKLATFSGNNPDDITTWFLKDKKVRNLFNLMKQVYNKAHRCQYVE